jgi:hypothetical protein
MTPLIRSLSAGLPRGAHDAVLGVDEPHRRRHRAAEDHRGARRLRALRLGVHGLHARLHRHHPDLRPPLRRPRPEAGADVRGGALLAGVGGGRLQREHARARRLAGRPGDRGRRADVDGLRRHRRHLPAPRAQRLPGPQRHRVGRIQRGRSRGRRTDHGPPRLALGLLRQRTDRRGGPDRAAAVPSPRRAAARRPRRPPRSPPSDGRDARVDAGVVVARGAGRGRSSGCERRGGHRRPRRLRRMAVALARPRAAAAARPRADGGDRQPRRASSSASASSARRSTCRSTSRPSSASRPRRRASP